MSDIPQTALKLVSAEAKGMKIRSRDGDDLGTVSEFMIDKRTGQSAYAVLSLGGFLGMNKSYYPVPFSLLRYEPVDDLYVVTCDRRLLEGGPSWASHAPEFNEGYADRVSSYYGQTSQNMA